MSTGKRIAGAWITDGMLLLGFWMWWPHTLTPALFAATCAVALVTCLVVTVALLVDDRR